MPTIGDDPVMPIPVSYALWTEDGNDSIPYAGEYGYRSLISWLNTVGSNVDYVSRVQFLPSEIVTSATIGSKGVILGGGDALFSISPSTTITLTSHQPVPSGVDNKKAYYAGIYNVYNKGSKIASFDSSYALQSDTQFSIVLTSGYGGVAARLKVVQAGTTDMYIPLTVPDAAVILDAYTTKEQDAARNVWSSVIAGALTGVMHGGVYGMAAGAAGGALAGSASAFAECMRASRQNVTIGQTPENYVYDSTPWLMVTWEHPDGQTQLRQYFRRHGYACTWRGSSFPGQRTYYNAYQGRARWWEDRDSTSLLSGVSREDINTAINDELGAGVVIWTLAQAANVGNTITVGNP